MYSFKIKLIVTRRPHMRDDNLEYLLCMGTGVLRQIFDNEVVDSSVKNVVLYYPERYMNIVEERSLYSRLARYCPNLESLEIMTQSVYLIQMTPRESVFIVEHPDDPGCPQESDTGRLWRMNVHGYDFSKLTVM
jgi:hypothetical protein